jgi:acetylglutamate kinase
MTEGHEQLRNLFPDAERLMGNRVVVKYGGAAMDNEDTKHRVCQEVAALVALGVTVIVVHGGGKEINRWLERLGLPARFVNGLRVTDEETMTVTEMVLTGLVNTDLVSRLQRLGISTTGLSGRHAGLLRAAPINHPDYGDLGRTGEVKRVDLSILSTLLAACITPVISPVGETDEGIALNLNADYAASALAGALRADACVFLTDVEGVRRGNEVLTLVTRKEAESMIAERSIFGGMIPKVECALRALSDGCNRAVITAAHHPYSITSALLGRDGSGTSFKETINNNPDY